MESLPEVASTDDFGNSRTVFKLEALDAYLTAFRTALKNQPFNVHYVDAFAGAGLCQVQIRAELVQIPGSSARALVVDPPFDSVTLIERDAKRAASLHRLCEAFPHVRTRVIHGDANDEVPGMLKGFARNDRVLMFVDPCGMDFAWSTLEQIGATEIVDVLYLFPLSGVYRQAANDAAAITPQQSAILDRALGTHDWYDAFYIERPHGDFFDDGPSSRVRSADVGAIKRFVLQRLRSVFPFVAEPVTLYQHHDDQPAGAPMFLLVLAVSNPSRTAHGLAQRIAASALKQR